MDFKPAYLDEIDMPQGNDDTTVASRKILDGDSMVNGDFSPAAGRSSSRSSPSRRSSSRWSRTAAAAGSR